MKAVGERNAGEPLVAFDEGALSNVRVLLYNVPKFMVGLIGYGNIPASHLFSHIHMCVEHLTFPTFNDIQKY